MTEGQFVHLWETFLTKVSQQRDELNQLDAAIGDADHGTNLWRGLTKVVTEVKAEGSLSKTCQAVGMTLLSTVGGASGALWGSALIAAAKQMPDDTTMGRELSLMALSAGIDQMSRRGKAVLGEKTMMDVWLPALGAMQGGQSVQDVADHAMQWAMATKPLLARKGRAAYLGERSQGHVDPGALSTALWWMALAEVMAS